MKWLSILVLSVLIVSCATPPSVSRENPEVTQTTIVTFGDMTTLSGTLQQIKTYGEDGRAVFPFFLKIPQGVIVRPDDVYAPGDTNEKIDGMEVVMLGSENIYETERLLRKYKDRQVIIEGRISGGLDLHCFNFGLFVNEVKSIKLK